MPEFYTEAEGAFTPRAELNLQSALLNLHVDVSSHVTPEAYDIAAGYLPTDVPRLRKLVGSLIVDSPNKLFFKFQLDAVRRMAISAEALGQDLRLGLQPRAMADGVAADIPQRAAQNVDSVFELVVDSLHNALGYHASEITDEEVWERLMTFGKIASIKPHHAGDFIVWLEESQTADVREKKSTEAYTFLDRIAVLAQATNCDLIATLDPKNGV